MWLILTPSNHDVKRLGPGDRHRQLRRVNDHSQSGTDPLLSVRSRRSKPVHPTISRRTAARSTGNAQCVLDRRHAVERAPELDLVREVGDRDRSSRVRQRVLICSLHGARQLGRRRLGAQHAGQSHGRARLTLSALHDGRGRLVLLSLSTRAVLVEARRGASGLWGCPKAKASSESGCSEPDGREYPLMAGCRQP